MSKVIVARAVFIIYCQSSLKTF